MTKFGKFGTIYRRLLCRHPLIVQSLQAGILMGSGDVLAQKVIENKCNIDYLRTARFFTLGTMLVGPALTKWYKFLSRQFGDCGRSAAFKKMAVDQLLFAPSFLGIFIVALNTMQGRDFECTRRELYTKYWDILLANYKLWPAVQLFNFYLTPLAYQVLAVQSVALIWNAYLSWKTQQEIKDEDDESDD